MTELRTGATATSLGAPAAESEQTTQVLWWGRGVVVAALVAMLISSALPWYSATVLEISVTGSGWHEMGLVVWPVTILAVVLTLATLAFRSATALDAVAAIAAGLAAGLCWLFVCVRGEEGAYGYGLLVAAAAATVAMLGAGLALTGFLQRWAARPPAAPVGMASTTAGPGWYPDPAGHGAHRWWNGLGWTEHVG